MFAGTGGSGVKDMPSKHKEAMPKKCATCHMYREKEDKILKSGGHTFRPDSRACLKCHEKPDALVAEWRGKISPLLKELKGLLNKAPDKTSKIYKSAQQNYDMVIGSRALGKREPGSMTPQQIFGNWLATRLLKLLYSANFTDLGPFRAIKYDRLVDLKMVDKTYGWTVEMQVKAAQQGLTWTEVPVNYRKRIGFSKVSGTVKGTFMAGYKIIWTIIRYL